MTVLQFSEVVQGTKADPKEQERIELKEALYHQLIRIEATKYGTTFEEELAIDLEENRISDLNHPHLYEKLAKQKGISIYEAQLDVRMGFLLALEKHAPDYRDPSRLTCG